MPSDRALASHDAVDRLGDERVGELAIGRTLVGRAGGVGDIPRAGGRGPGVEVAHPGEPLPDEGAPDDAPVGAHDQRSVGPMGKQHLRESSNDPGIDATGKEHQEKRQEDRGTELVSEHGGRQTRWTVTSSMSMSLMPTNGMITPPTP